MKGTMSKDRYQEYLQSPWWQQRRQLRLEVAGHVCEFRPDEGWDHNIGTLYGERCNATRNLEVHHKNYRSLHAERDEDLEVLCCFHHLVRHITSVECDRCGETIQLDDDVAEDMVREAIAGEDGNVRAVDPANIDVGGLCDYCDHMMSKD
jgi:hypothetical protein